jgi:hypothetical protein
VALGGALLSPPSVFRHGVFRTLGGFHPALSGAVRVLGPPAAPQLPTETVVVPALAAATSTSGREVSSLGGGVGVGVGGLGRKSQSEPVLQRAKALPRCLARVGPSGAQPATAGAADTMSRVAAAGAPAAELSVSFEATDFNELLTSTQSSMWRDESRGGTGSTLPLNISARSGLVSRDALARQIAAVCGSSTGF